MKSICQIHLATMVAMLVFSSSTFANCLGSPTPCSENDCLPVVDCGFLPNAAQIAINANAGMSLGIVRLDEFYSYGFSIAGKLSKVNNTNSNIFTPSIFGGGRYRLDKHAFFAYGIDVVSKFGKVGGQSVKNSIGAGPYLQLDYHLNNSVVLSGWINPYFYNREKIIGITNKTQSYFNTGGIGVSYMF